LLIVRASVDSTGENLVDMKVPGMEVVSMKVGLEVAGMEVAPASL